MKRAIVFSFPLWLNRIRIAGFLYANEAHNILMTGLGTHERFTIEMRTCVQRTSKKISILKKIQSTTPEK